MPFPRTIPKLAEPWSMEEARARAQAVLDRGRDWALKDVPRLIRETGDSLVAQQKAQIDADRVAGQVVVRALRKPFGGRPVLSAASPQAPEYAPWREPLLPRSVDVDGRKRSISYQDYNRRYPPALDAFERRIARDVTGRNLEHMQDDPKAHAYEIFRPPGVKGAPVDNMPAMPRPLPENLFGAPFKLPVQDGAEVDVFGLPWRKGRVRIERDPVTGAIANITEDGHMFHGDTGGGYVITPAQTEYPIHASGVGDWPEVNEEMGPVVFAPKNQRPPPRRP